MRRRYLSLGLGELAATGVFAVEAWLVVLPVLPDDARVALFCALAPLLVLLIQAGAYWLLARSWLGHTVMPRPLAVTFRVFRVANPLLLAGGLVGVVATWPGVVGGVLLLAVWAFGVVEYVNYFVARLSYPIGTWARQVTRWRTPALVRDVRRGLAATASR